MRIASTTKHFTCLAALLLAEEGKLDLDAPATRYLPELPTPRGVPTLRQFMTHTSGVRCYVDLLLKEADLVLARMGGLNGRRLRVGSIHLGGGTPNMLPPQELERLFAGLAARFDLGDCFEIAAELDPEVLTQDWIEAAGRIGLSRASLGVQDLSPVVQAAVNRPESFETIRWAAQALRAQGVTSLNLDLMYGLPLQAVENVVNTVAQVATLRPDRIALFGYAHVPWMKSHQKLIKDADLPGAEARFAQSQAAARYLVQKGWQAIGLDHFALPHDSMAAAARAGRLRRNGRSKRLQAQRERRRGHGLAARPRARYGNRRRVPQRCVGNADQRE
jgi:oxygen-independent coproporphyrinogen-3 oxidase